MENDSKSRDNVSSRFDTFRDGLRKALSSNLLLSIGLTISISGNAVQWKYEPAPIVIATDHAGQYAEPPPLTGPIMTDPEIIDWTVKKMQAACSLGWLHYDEQLAALHTAFLDNGWAAYQAELDRKNVRKQLMHDRLDMGCNVTHPGVISSKDIVDGRLVYRISAPFVTRYYGQNADLDREQNGTYTAIVARVPLTEKPNGWGIFSIIFSPPSSEPLDGIR